jgi:Uma2 family endonuclease
MTTLAVDAIVYPESDGLPMADNMTQARWISLIYCGLRELYAYHPNVLVAKDHFWYPVRGEPKIRQAPDVYVVLGRPKHDRGSYLQWREADLPLTVAFEIRSPSNTEAEMATKHGFYEEHGVQEYYDFDPETNHLMVFRRVGDVLRGVAFNNNWTSPLLGIRFELTQPEMTIWTPENVKFLWPEENRVVKDQFQRDLHTSNLAREAAEKGRRRERRARRQAEHTKQQAEWDKQQAERDKQQAEWDKQQAERDKQQAELAKLKAERDKQQAEWDKQQAERDKQQAEWDKQQAERDKQQAEWDKQRIQERLARLKELGRKLRQGQLTPAELQEWEALEAEDAT